jgi:hypothetical protein
MEAVKRSGLIAVLAIAVVGCGGSATPTPPAASGPAASAVLPPTASAAPASSAPAPSPTEAPPPSAVPSEAVANSPPSAPSSATPSASAAPVSFSPVTITGRGNKTVAFTIPAGAPAIMVIRNAGKRAFSVTTLAIGGVQDDVLVSVTGSFQGTFLIDKRAGEHSVAVRIRSDGLWQIDVRPVSMARTWDGKQGLAGQGNDVIQLDPVNNAPLTATLTHVGKGRLVMNVYAPSPSLLVNETGPYDKPVTFPAGTILIEVLTGTNWGLVPG